MFTSLDDDDGSLSSQELIVGGLCHVCAHCDGDFLLTLACISFVPASHTGPNTEKAFTVNAEKE